MDLTTSSPAIMAVSRSPDALVVEIFWPSCTCRAATGSCDPRASHTRSKARIFGTNLSAGRVLPFSQLISVNLLMPHRSANSCWVRPNSRRRFLTCWPSMGGCGMTASGIKDFRVTGAHGKKATRPCVFFDARNCNGGRNCRPTPADSSLSGAL